MALPTSQPMTEVLRGWTVARGIPTGNDAAGQNTRHPIPPGESMAELGQYIFRHRAGHPARCDPDSGGVRGPAGRLEEAVTLPRLLRYPSAERTATGGMLPMEIHRHMPARECENDMGGRFTKSPISTHNGLAGHVLFFPSHTPPARPALGRTGETEADGSDPPVRGPGAGMGRCGFSHAPPRLRGVAPVSIDPCGKATECR